MSNELQAAKDYAPPPMANSVIVQADFRERVNADRLVNDLARELGEKLRKRKTIFRFHHKACIFDEEGNLRPISAAEFPSWLESAAGGNIVCQKSAGQGEKAELVDWSLNKTGSEMLLASRDLRVALPKIRRINRVRLPVWRSSPNGLPKIELLPAGYDEESETYTFVDVEYDEQMPFEKACAVINELFQDVAFDRGDQARSFACGIAMLMTPFCDQLLDYGAPRPAFIVTGNSDSAGKTLLVKMALLNVFGSSAPTGVPQQDKMREELFAASRDGKLFLFFDNWKGKIENPDLESALSNRRLTGRTLGQATTFDAPFHALVFFTANNASIERDMRRRSIIINLFIEDAVPESRKVKRALEERELIEARADVLAAQWAIVRYWMEQGKFYRGKPNRSFVEWGEVIGGIVESVCSGQSPLEPSPVSFDERLAAWTRFLSEFFAKHPDLLNEGLKFSELRDLARGSGAFGFLAETDSDLSPEDRKREDSILSKRFCEHFRNRRFNLAIGAVWFLDNGEIGRAKRYTITMKAPAAML
jgi:hypothetical protein